MKKLFRITTIPYSLSSLLKGQLRYMSEHYQVTAISSPSGDFLDKFGKDNNVQVVGIEMTRKITLIKDLKATWKLYRLFKREQPYIVHTHTPKAGTVGMLAAYLAGVPNRLHTIAGLPLLEATGFKRFVLDNVEKITYRCATRVYPNSIGLNQIVLHNKYAKINKLKVIGNGSSNGIDTQYFDPNLFTTEQNGKLRNTLNISQDDFVFIFVGRIVKDKGISELISAFNKLSKNYSKIKLLLVGTFERHLDPLNDSTEEIILNNEAIIHVGLQKDVRPYFAISNLLVFPSYREGFPNVVMESGAMGLPTIASDINGCNEIIVDGKNGIIVPPKDEDALYQAMQDLLLNQEKRTKISSNARQMIKSRYERNYIWSELLKEYTLLD
jgi:glycosyltransferase involved in cell wall biosynthesis